MFIEKPYKIALIDDDPLILALMHQVISKEKDVEVLAFQNPQEGLEAIRNQKIRLVFVDINMPQMFGDDLLRECVSMKQGIQVYVVTGTGSLIIVERCFNVGARDVLPKPVHIPDLQAAVREGIQHLDLWNERINRSARKTA
jgi:DNA-binding NtrC family response regulator